MKRVGQALLWTLTAFVVGAMPFSLWIGHWWLGRDIRQVGDGNPGATNVWRAGGRVAAAVALLLDMLKGALPVGLARATSLDDSVWLAPIALAPVLGHAASPFMGGRGGKAVAVTGGVWAGLTTWEGPTIGGCALALFTRLLGANGRAVMAALVTMLLYLLLTPPRWNHLIQRPDPRTIAAVGLGNLAIVAWKHQRDLYARP